MVAASSMGVPHSTHACVMVSASFMSSFSGQGMSQFPTVFCQGVEGGPALLVQPQLL